MRGAFVNPGSRLAAGFSALALAYAADVRLAALEPLPKPTVIE